MTSFNKDSSVQHTSFGYGQVITDQGESVVVRFEHGIEECLVEDINAVESLSEQISINRYDPPTHVVTRVLGECIRSVNDAWGMFSQSRIALLPHQLWVCKRVLESWPTRWLVADDVGLGKTIEAGLILTPLLSSGRVRRLLILVPASLVGQWQLRLREMFDIRLTNYASSIDTPISDFWNTQDRVIGSAHTLRLNKASRWERLLNSKPWDMVIVDEAHHMNVDEQDHRTLSYQLVEKLQQRGHIQSLVMFTGTPHRGRDKAFLSLLKLLRPEDFDPEKPLEEEVGKLHTAMIRNNKQSVTDMAGKLLFTPVKSRLETYTYSPQENQFYHQLTQFIKTGKTHAANINSQRDQRIVILTLITMQKLASSSVAAVRRALQRRLDRLRHADVILDKEKRDLKRLQELQDEDGVANQDEISRLEERIVESVKLNPNEIPALEELLETANKILEESKITRILDMVDELSIDRSVLFFTEYKATQSLLMGALQKRYGDGCVTFINGDNIAEGVANTNGMISDHTEKRQDAAQRFNRGDVRFLVSTEAAGEGIDLQQHCSALIHVDLPWNPMRLHQRVGRLSRYGQKHPVDVVSVRNPDTIESRIWELLDEKLDRISVAFQGSMDDPEDIRQLVLGTASPSMFPKLFSEPDPNISGPNLKDWFQKETATFGGDDVVTAVRKIIRSVARFDFGEVEGQIPRVDLPDLLPFFKTFLSIKGRGFKQIDTSHLQFRPPKEWKNDFTIATNENYNLLFSRTDRHEKKTDIAGVGSRVVDRAISDALNTEATFTAVRGLESSIFVFSIRDRITGTGGPIRTVIVATKEEGGAWKLIRDWELIKILNPLADKPRSLTLTNINSTSSNVLELMKDARKYIESGLDTLELPFELPLVEGLACLLPVVKKAKGDSSPE